MRTTVLPLAYLCLAGLAHAASPSSLQPVGGDAAGVLRTNAVLKENAPSEQAAGGVQAGDMPEISGSDAAKVPVLQHVAAAGAVLNDLGTAHGIRTVLARHGAEFMVLGVTPDGQAAVAGVQSDMSIAQLLAIARGQVTELGTVHGMRGLFVRNGAQFQVFYATPDGERVIPGVMWAATGKNVTRDQVAAIEGTIPTVEIGSEKAPARGSASPADPAPGASPLALVKDTHYGTHGRARAPRLWVFIDPQCSYSIQAMAKLEPYVLSGRVELAVIPLAVLDYEDEGRSTPSALAMLSKPADEMVAAWRTGHLEGPPADTATADLKTNMAAANAIHLRGTPTLVWRKSDGAEGRIDGVPQDIDAVVASIGG
jgi:thiol:disulfide interchange protein DsbG